ncbi:tellurium resistance protein TerD [Streptomyces nodosus]|uniref:TerD-family protein n=1 Tax=Streptomyces nodosus TaxID=40318 RepID=A0A0B5DI41_9ACTN|nr:TerD family protein [Streptomyces nodosus]AJE43373.1 TerD-family protein [Streptomyces nodosus]MBB4794811.1 tellurium resistance protein TerD [Streptomyces nodosus]QEV41869.1 TerD family protein [Streptomyces nodosus]
MSVPLAKGGNVSLSRQAPGLTAVTVGLGWQTDAGCELDASALLCDGSGKVLSDEHFVFFNNLSSPDGSVRHSGGSPVVGDDQQISVDLTRVPGEVTKIVFPVSIYEGAARGQTFGHVPRAHIRVLDQEGGTELARYDLAPGGAADETALVFGELYRHGAEWKFRAVGQGYASGLAGIATDYGVDVLREADPAPAPAPGTYDPPPPAFAPAAPSLVSPQPPTVIAPPQPSGSPDMTCFFDPAHGPGTTSVSWYPQWGVPRPVQACAGCAQRVQTTAPPYYTPPQPVSPPPVQPGYPQAQQGYPAAPVQQGYPAPQGDQQQGGRRFGTGALIGAGAAGLVGGALLNEAFSDDEPDVVINNYYED